MALKVEKNDPTPFMYKRMNLFGKFKLKQKSSNVMTFELFFALQDIKID